MIVVNSRFLTQRISGVQRYAIEICKYLPKKINNHNVFFVAPKGKLINQDVLPNVNIVQIGNFKNNLWEQIDLVKYLKKNANPLLINFGGIGPVNYQNKITFIHDLSFKYYPKHYSFLFQKAYNKFIPKSARNSKKIITVSNYVKDDIEKSYGLKNIEVIYPAVNDTFKDLKRKREKLIISVSSMNPRKNIKALIEAFNRIKSDYKLVFIGGEANVYTSLHIDPTKYKNIHFTGYVSDQELIEFYNKASIFAYPSTFEGFGIPPLEAQACGCPCLVSNVTSLPEVCLSSAEYCDPFSINSIMKGLEKLINDPKRRTELGVLGVTNINRFGWRKSAKKLVGVIEKTLD